MITLLAVTDGYKHFSIAIDEYVKRTQKYITIKRLKPIAHTNPEYIRVKETLTIIDTLEKMRGSIYLLDERGTSISTHGLVDIIESSQMQGEPPVFVIGGSYGVDLELFAQIPHKTLRISDLVLPHSMALLIIIEQIYRAHEIMRGTSYHHN